MLLLSNRIRGLAPLVSAVVCLGVASPGFAGTVYHWETDDGIFAYTDDPKHIPAAYKKAAKRRDFGRLSGYKRYTPSLKKVGAPYVERLSQRLEALRADDVDAAPTTALLSSGVRGVQVRVALPNLEIDVPRAEGESPVVVEEIRTRVPGLNATRTVQVVRQNGQTIAIIKPHPNQSDVSWVVSEDDL